MTGLPRQQSQPAQQPSPQEQKLLAQLHDIHQPAPVSWWPPAPGWWALAALVLAVIAAGLLWMQRRRQRRARNLYRVEATRLLRAVETDRADATQQINEILKRVAVTSFGRAHCGNLTGERWLNFLHRSAAVDCPAAVRSALLEHLYRTDHPDPEATEALRDFALRWVETHQLERPRQSQAAVEATGV
ncbi:DUF4381 domain-containing protein [Microbulbifer sp. SAOS-129_SWC]|uniref:DUF4381 domain-containing protein n=1 Tax=Microbulbifer sp. SAOS-129_SWC TaxID=3145235 RepID=UPI0032164E6A